MKINPNISLQKITGTELEEGFTFANFTFYPRNLSGTVKHPLGEAPCGGFTFDPVSPTEGFRACRGSFDDLNEAVMDFMKGDSEIAITFYPDWTGPVSENGTYDYWVTICTKD